MGETEQVLRADAILAIGYIPRLAGAIVIVLLGAISAWIIGRIVAGLLSRVGFDKLADRTGLTSDLSSIGIRSRPSALVGRVAFFIVLVAAAAQAIDTLEFAPISLALASLLAYAPHIVLAVVLLLLGVIFADIVSSAVAKAMSRAGILYHGPAAIAVRSTIIGLAVLMALQQLTIESQFLLAVVLVVFGAGALAFGISFGLGARFFAENLVASRYLERHLHVGDTIAAESVSGTILSLDSACTTVVTSEGEHVLIPNSSLSHATIRVAVAPNAAEDVQPAGPSLGPEG